MTTRTTADRARELHELHPSWSAADIAFQLDCSRQAVYTAIKRGGKRKAGRPRTRKVCVHCGR